MRVVNHLHLVRPGFTNDPRMHGIANGLEGLFELPEVASLPKELKDGVARLEKEEKRDARNCHDE